MNDLQNLIDEWKAKNPDRAKGFDEGYELFKIGALIQQAREAAGLTQQELAARINTKKSAISRTENHAADIKISTLEKIAGALDMKLQIKLVKHNA
jgi:HTH-type transcriptional regulator/antitoxin HipB